VPQNPKGKEAYLDRGIDKLQSVSPTSGLLGVVGSRESSDLPLSVHFVTETPELDVVRLVSSSVLTTKVRPAKKGDHEGGTSVSASSQEGRRTMKAC
jgi:hypothetical protein